MADYLKYLGHIASIDIEQITAKERTYKGSWKKRGGIGASMMLLRKADRLENMLVANHYDIFGLIEAEPHGKDGSALSEIRDLRCYLLLVEAEMMSRGVVPVMPILKPTSTAYGAGGAVPNGPGTPEDGGQHARYEEE